MSKNKEHKKESKVFLFIFIGLIALVSIFGFYVYSIAFSPNTNIGLKGKYLYIPNGANYKTVMDSLTTNQFLKDISSFEKLAEYKKYSVNIKPGRYSIKEGISNNELINKLRSSNQDPVNLVLFGIRKKEDLAGKISKKIDLDSMDILEKLNDDKFLSKYGMDADNILSLFIPNTYQIFWNSSIEEFMDKMAGSYKSFWTEERKKKALELELSQSQISVLASIIQAETNKLSDKPIIAGVYINRLHKNIPLEADPTLVWALNDFTIKRVLNKHKKVVSPYNTYMNQGLPPGPILLPSIESLDAALNPEKHNFIYFCAKEDFSGYSNFASTLKEHLKNARKYQNALSERGIMR